ncbi:MAG: TonB-dependent receptor plug domain-containing protein [Porticoccaceae bacterium]
MSSSTRWKLNTITAAVITAGATLTTTVSAGEAALLEEVVIVGSRGAPRTVTDSSVPVDVLSADELNKAGNNDVLEQLKSAIPSLNVHLQPISDAASIVRPANLRGLPSDSTLIMVNGKRRHRASVIAFQGMGLNDGAQGPDISVIPSIALKQVEVLRDGASAQYGSDAIAGVINFVLNDASEGTEFFVKRGQYQAGDGDTTTVAGNIGLPLTDAGFMNISFQMREADPTSRSVQRGDAAKLKVAGNDEVKNPAQIWGSPEIDDDVTFFFNSGLDLGNGSEAYMFGNYSERDVEGGFYYRNPNDKNGVFTYETEDEKQYRLVADLGGCAEDVDANIIPNIRKVDPNNKEALKELMASEKCYIHNKQASTWRIYAALYRQYHRYIVHRWRTW